MAQPSVTLSKGEVLEGEVVVLSCFERSKPDAGRAQRRLASAIHRASDSPGWKAKERQVTRSATLGASSRNVEIHGLGKRTDFADRELTAWLTRVSEAAIVEGRRELMLVLPEHPVVRGRNALRILTQILLSGYRFEVFRSQKRRPSLRKVVLLPPVAEDEAYRSALPLARKVARGVRFCRDLGNTPPNEATPEWMAEQSAALAQSQGFECRILTEAELQEMGMGGILAVGSGSRRPPRMVRLEWGEGDEITAFIGKGVTFDTGGISIKPSAAMEEMKYDKCGACTVLGISRTLAELQLPGRFRAYLPLVENMPGGGSYRPGDIVRCYNGKTVEILDTDAEGRMILADALSWAAAEKPNTMVEMSTLTGASVVALGQAGAALYTPDPALEGELQSAGESSGERLWPMPLWPEFAEEMKGAHADLRNLGSRWGGANSAAAFLGNFVGKTKRWAHLDIAGTAYRASRSERISAATGFGVGLTVNWLLSRSGRF